MRRHVGHRDGVAVAHPHDDLAELLDRLHPSPGADRQVLRSLLEPASRNLDVLRLQRPGDLRHGEVVGAQTVGIEPQVDLPAAAANHQHLADAGHGLEAAAQHLVRVLRDLLDRPRGGHREPEHRRRVHVHLLDDRLQDRARQQRQDAVDLVAHLLGGHVDVLLEQERCRHERYAFGGRRAQLVQAADGVDGFFNLVGDLGFDLLRRGPGLPRRDHDRGEIDLREPVDSQLRVPERADHGERQHEDRREHRPSHAERRKPLHTPPLLPGGRRLPRPPPRRGPARRQRAPRPATSPPSHRP